ncbi:YqzE family protein [Paraliobacillus sp. JSM ZJ581]|uniref:YqzE family protein n=1 Tax=Paraliobacillus sp. JSM ZJ581 TaxID=3342118 RepID=UPI0035A8CFC8
MSGNDIVKYVTTEIVKYAGMSKEKREQYKQEKKDKKKESQFFLSSNWFGLVPFSLHVWLKRNKNRR